MVKIVILGSCKYEPYEVILIPNRDLSGRMDPSIYERDHEAAYKIACKIVYPAIDEADIVFVYAPEGIGEHTGKDLDYVKTKEKPFVVYIKKARE